MTVLVVVEKGAEGEELLRKAGQLATGADTDVVLLSILTEAEFESDMETIEAIAEVENTAFGREEVMDSAQQFAARLADEVLDDEVSWETVEIVLGDRPRATRIWASPGTAETSTCGSRGAAPTTGRTCPAAYPSSRRGTR